LPTMVIRTLKSSESCWKSCKAPLRSMLTGILTVVEGAVVGIEVGGGVVGGLVGGGIGLVVPAQPVPLQLPPGGHTLHGVPRLHCTEGALQQTAPET
jgi:hypothetical protein